MVLALEGALIILALLHLAGANSSNGGGRRLRITNACDREPIWIAHMAAQGSGPDPQNLKLPPLSSHDFATPDGLSGTRYWPKMQCNKHGNMCSLGDSGGPDQKCNLTSGCAPPVDSKFEASFGMDGVDWVDVSLVDGWTLPFAFKMSKQCDAGDGNRTLSRVVNCSNLTLEDCPTDETLPAATDSGDMGRVSLQLRDPTTHSVVGCYSPCSKLTLNHWQNNYSYAPSDDTAVPYCCPTPPESPGACRRGPVEQTSFVKAVHKHCPGVYGYSYDDGMGLITCPVDTEYEMIYYCPNIMGPRPTPRPKPQPKPRPTAKPTRGPSPAATPAPSRAPAAPTPGPSPAPTPGAVEGAGDQFRLRRKKGSQHCGDKALFAGPSFGKADCQRRCASHRSCKFFSIWYTGGLHWCRLTTTCDVISSDGIHQVAIYGLAPLGSQLPAGDGSSGHVQFPFKGPGPEYCADTATFAGPSGGLEDCAARCLRDAGCEFYSIWNTGGLHWCRLTSACYMLLVDLPGTHSITVWSRPVLASNGTTTASASGGAGVPEAERRRGGGGSATATAEAPAPGADGGGDEPRGVVVKGDEPNGTEANASRGVLLQIRRKYSLDLGSGLRGYDLRQAVGGTWQPSLAALAVAAVLCVAAGAAVLGASLHLAAAATAAAAPAPDEPLLVA